MCRNPVKSNWLLCTTLLNTYIPKNGNCRPECSEVEQKSPADRINETNCISNSIQLILQTEHLHTLYTPWCGNLNTTLSINRWHEDYLQPIDSGGTTFNKEWEPTSKNVEQSSRWHSSRGPRVPSRSISMISEQVLHERSLYTFTAQYRNTGAICWTIQHSWKWAPILWERYFSCWYLSYYETQCWISIVLKCRMLSVRHWLMAVDLYCRLNRTSLGLMIPILLLTAMYGMTEWPTDLWSQNGWYHPR